MALTMAALPAADAPGERAAALVLRNGEDTHTIPLGARVELRGAKWRSLGQGRLVAATDSTLTILGPHSNVVAVEDIARITNLRLLPRSAHTTHGEIILAILGTTTATISVIDKIGWYDQNMGKRILESAIVIVFSNAPLWWSRLPPTHRYKIGPEDWQIEVIPGE